MKTHLYTTIFCSLTFWAMAQPNHHGGRERVEAFKVQYLTQELDLDSKEAQKFWPLYNELKSKEHEIQEARMEAFVHVHDIVEMTDAEADQIMKAELERQEKLIALRREYYEKMKGSLGAKKAAQYYKAEIHFHKKLINKLHDRRDRK